MKPATCLPRARWPLALLGLLTLSGCASFSPDGGFDRVRAIAKERLGQPIQRQVSEEDGRRIRAEVDRLLGEPLTPDSAVQVALLNNRGLQAGYAELGIAEADLVQAGRLRNPGFTFSRIAGGGEREYERGFLFDLMSLLTLSTRKEIEARRFEHAQLQVADSVLRLAAQTRQAYVMAVAAREAAKYLEQVEQAAEAGSQLAGRMAEAGNFDRLRRSREQLLHAETKAQLTGARLAAVAAEERLTRLLGLDAPRYTLPDRLPDLPAAPLEEGSLQQQAMDRRLDLMMARQEIESLAKNLGLNRATRFVNVLEVGYLNTDVTGEPHKRGYEIELRLPLFDWGGARVAKAEALYTQALHRVAQIAVNARSEVREAYAAYRAAHELVRHYRDEIVPLRKRISEENLLRYNGMLISVWELLADARAQVASVSAYLDALEGFWLAEANLQASLNGGGAAGVVSVSTGRPLTVEREGGH